MGRSERAALDALVWTLVGVTAAIPMLGWRSGDEPLALATVHLSALVLYGFALSFRVAGRTDREWFTGVRAQWRPWLTGVWAVVLVTGSVGLVTLATSAALRYEPSMQYLQVLSAVDIAWAGAAIVVGLRWWRGSRAALVGAAFLGAVCVWSIWRYLVVVGFGPEGAWVVDGGRILTMVLPYDTAAAVMAVTALWLGVRARRS